MKQPNFFQKHLVTIIIILLFGIAIIIGIKQGFNDYQNEKNSLSPLGQTPEKDSLEPETPTNPSRMKRSTEETLQPKIQTIAAKLEQIKTYLFTEPTDTSKLPSDLSAREQEEINKLKNSWQLSFNLLKEQKTWVDEKQKVCDEHQFQLNSIQPQIEALKPKQQKLEKQRDEKKEILKKIKYQCGEISPSYAKMLKKMYNIEIKNPKIPNQIEEIRLQAEIDKLKAEISEIVGEIGKIKVQIGKLESKQEKYQEMLSGAEMLKKDLEKRYQIKETEYKNEILKSLDSLYEITPNEG
ncbi:hypothetical protein [Candidatus Phytoplasma australiense]|uniref:Uncharacterized protein n=1 Tax=Strawberry lethal yellows phytoplasma (CPA) str. NZSb11 TaxID=980422 RepID=R4RR76_PHYAS|nr:hypothetical protein [Candidatus Phytoplasma australiense]AGL91006.1 Hypothetical Protein yibP [Strawberry lethal yellows phytoplasma (CPA) str. NZSb11]